MEQQEQLTEFKIQLALPAPNIEVAQEVANKAQVLINPIWILSISKTGRLHAEESRCSIIRFKLNK
jgi:hypothetical protein